MLYIVCSLILNEHCPRQHPVNVRVTIHMCWVPSRHVSMFRLGNGVHTCEQPQTNPLNTCREKRMPRVRIELTTFRFLFGHIGLWDWRAAYCATEAARRCRRYNMANGWRRLKRQIYLQSRLFAVSIYHLLCKFAVHHVLNLSRKMKAVSRDYLLQIRRTKGMQNTTAHNTQKVI